MKEKIKEILDMSCEHFVAMPRKCKQRAAKEITAHVFEFIHWLLTETNYPLRFGEINKEETAKYHQYWINNLKK